MEDARGSGTKKRTGGAGKAILWAFITALVMKFFLFDFMITEGNSMIPAIKPGTILLISRVYYGIRKPGTGKYLVRWKQPQIGDIVVFYTPLGEIAVKRCGNIIPGNEFYAIGDNLDHSYDSRNYGPVLNDKIIGKVLGIK